MRQFKKGDKVVILTAEANERYFKVGEICTLADYINDNWWADFGDGRHWALSKAAGTTFKLLNDNEMNNNLAKIVYRNTIDGMIEILRFENVLTEQEIREKLGN
jgi:hypothetical protein